MNLQIHCAASFWTLAASALLTTGCVGPVPTSNDSQRINDAVGVGDAVVWNVTAEPLDAAQGSEDALTLTAVARLSLRHDPNLQAALARVRAAEADSEQARLLPNPILSVAVRSPTGGGKPEIAASLEANLLSLLQRPRRASAADARLRAASAEVLTVALDLLLEVQNGYAGAEAAEALQLVMQERKKLIGRLLDVAQSRVRIGESPQLDALTLDVERLSLDVEIAEKSAELRQQKLNLARLIGQPSRPIDPRLQPTDPPPTWAGNERICIEAAMTHRPEMQAVRWELAALGDEQSLAGWNVFDGLAAGADAERDPDWTVGPAVSTPLPIFDLGQARRDKAAATIIEARHKFVGTQRQIVLEVRQAIDAVRSAQATLRTVQDALVPLQQRRIEQAEAAYRNGLADSTVVLIAEQESQAAKQKEIELRQAVATAFYRLDRAVGGSAVRQTLSTTQAVSTQGEP